MRRAGPADAGSVAALLGEREGLPAAVAQEVVRRWLADQGQLVLVAERRDRVLGYARAARIDLHGTPDADASGWHLTGVVVAPNARRHGLGRALTVARLQHLTTLTGTVWCVVNTLNRASLDLHRGLGFAEVRRGPQLAGVAFSGGSGVLLRRDLGESWAEQTPGEPG